MNTLHRHFTSRSWLSTAAYLFLVTLFGLPIVSPLIRYSSLPCTHDGHLHYHRVAALSHAWENGLYFSRWLPDLSFGYGYPFFNFREAAPLYLTLWLDQVGFSLPAALNTFYILTILAAGWFMFLWVRDLFGPVAGVVSGVAYMAAPYLLIDALIRGNQPESIALALLPLLCWTGRRFMIQGKAMPLMASVLAYLLLALSHNISLLLFTPFLFIYLAFVGWLARYPFKRIAGRLALLFGLGLAISAFYVGPALLELDQITISQSVSARNNDFRFNFSTLAEFLAPVSPADPTLINPPLLIRLGWVPLILGLFGLILGLLSKSREIRAQTIFIALAAIFLLFMSMAVSSFLWETIPLIEFVQFPWRFIGRAALPLAFLAGMTFGLLPELWKNQGRAELITLLFAGLAVALLIFESIPYLYPPQCRTELEPTINAVHTYERSSGLVGVDPLGSYFPKTVQERPKGSPLEVDLQGGVTPRRFDETALPEDSVLNEVEYGPLYARVEIDGPSPFEARYLSFAFPGWTVSIDGEPAAILPSDPGGLITFSVPAGRHTIEVDWRTTPLRRAMTAISIAAAILLIFATVFLYRKQDNSGPAGGSSAESAANAAENSDMQDEKASHLWLWSLGVFLTTALLLIILKFLLVDPRDTVFNRPGDAPVSNRSDITASGLSLIGSNMAEGPVEAGTELQVDLAWESLQTPLSELQSNLWLRDSEGLIWSDKETYRPRVFQEPSPTTFWLPDQWAWDSRLVQALEGTPPGVYDLVVTLFNRQDLQPVTLFGPDGQAIGPETVIGQVEVAASDRFYEDSPQYRVDVVLSGLHLLGYNIDRAETIPGDHFLLTLFWDSDDSQEGIGDRLNLHLVDASGDRIQTWTFPPVRDSYPPSAWEGGLVLRGQHSLGLRSELPGGDYILVLEDLRLAELRIAELNRLFEPPPLDVRTELDFGEQLSLTGYSIKPSEPEPGSTMEVKLGWQAVTDMDLRYRIFVHLIDETGQILDQSDGEPAAWARPTTSWTQGEYILDQHILTTPKEAPPASLALRIGVYDPASGQRLSVGGEEFILIPLEPSP